MRLLLLLLTVLFTLGSAFSAEGAGQNYSDEAPLDIFKGYSLIAIPDRQDVHSTNNPDHEYRVTVADYCSFLNAVAFKADPYGLYDERMTTDPVAAYLTRNGEKGHYRYEVVPGCEALPITYVNEFAIARYCNWLGNEQPHGREGVDTTEDGIDTLEGATTVNGLNHEVLNKYQYTLTSNGDPEYKDNQMGFRLYVMEPHVADFRKQLLAAKKADKVLKGITSEKPEPKKTEIKDQEGANDHHKVMSKEDSKDHDMENVSNESARVMAFLALCVIIVAAGYTGATAFNAAAIFQ